MLRVNEENYRNAEKLLCPCCARVVPAQVPVVKGALHGKRSARAGSARSHVTAQECCAAPQHLTPGIAQVRAQIRAA